MKPLKFTLKRIESFNFDKFKIISKIKQWTVNENITKTYLTILLLN